MGVGSTGYPNPKTENPNPFIAPQAIINSKWITDLNVKPKTTQFLEKVFVMLGYTQTSDNIPKKYIYMN